LAVQMVQALPPGGAAGGWLMSGGPQEKARRLP